MVQAGIIKVVYRKISRQGYKIYSPFKSIKEFFRFILLIIFVGALILVNMGFYPFEIFSSSILYEISFFIASILISTAYWKYVEVYKEGSVYVPKFSEYKLQEWLVVIICLMGFGTAAIMFPYSPAGPIGFGIWFIMLSRFLIGE